MEGFQHLFVPAGYRRVMIPDPVEKIADDICPDAGHVAGGNEDQVAVRGKGAGMESPDRADPPPDIGDAPDIPEVGKPAALFRVAGDKDDLVDNGPDRIDLPLDEGLSLVPEEIFLLAVRPLRLAADKDDG
jgi:hypothetical protein